MIKSYIFSDSEKVPWRESNFAQGVQVKDLGVSDGQAMQLVKFAAGAQFPWHKHTGPEFIYVFSGEVIQRGRRLSAGWAGVAPAGTEEDDFASETGAIFLIVYTE